MENCRAKYYQEIDIVEHIMQFREVKAELDAKLRRNKSENEVSDENSERRNRLLFFKRARTKVLTE